MGVEEELSPENADKYFEWLERQFSPADREGAARIHVHRVGARLECAFALTKGAGRYQDVMTASCGEAVELESVFRQYAMKIWASLFSDPG
jgi:hypothetical protein